MVWGILPRLREIPPSDRPIPHVRPTGIQAGTPHRVPAVEATAPLIAPSTDTARLPPALPDLPARTRRHPAPTTQPAAGALTVLRPAQAILPIVAVPIELPHARPPYPGPHDPSPGGPLRVLSPAAEADPSPLPVPDGADADSEYRSDR